MNKRNPVGEEIIRENLQALGFKPDFAELSASRLYYFFLERIEQKRDRDQKEMFAEAAEIIRSDIRAQPAMDLIESVLGFYPGPRVATLKDGREVREKP